MLAREDGHAELATCDGLKPEQLATRMINALEASGAGENWAYATLGEAAIALRDYQKAKHWYTEFGRHPKTRPFHAASASRQLEEVWRLTPSHGGAGPLFAVLKAAEIGDPNGQFTLPAGSLGDIAKFASTPEARNYRESMVQGGHFVPLAELQVVVRRASAVVAIQSAFGGTIGTGFLVRGRSLSNTLGDDVYMVTNAHVLSESGGESTLHPSHARLILEGAQGVQLTCDSELVWESPPSVYDAAIVRITGGPSGSAEPLELAEPDLPLRPADASLGREGSPVSVIGYPLGGPLSLGRVVGANGQLVDLGPRQQGDQHPVYLHYKAPTEPGNSGSPIFETHSWRVVGLHHAGFNQYEGRPRLNGVAGSAFANEGICIQSIRRALKELGGGRKKSFFGS
jgi:S1-C subfamily serine protease